MCRRWLNEPHVRTFNQTVRASVLSLAGLLALSFSITACDDDDDVADATFEPESVPESKPIDDLDEDEEEAFCEEAAGWAEDVLGDQLSIIFCNSTALTMSFGEDGSVDLAECRAQREACLNDPEMTAELEFGDEGLECNFEGIEDCGATVGEFSDCFEETARLLDRTAAQVTCEQVANGNLPDESDFMLSAQCEALFERCGGDSSEGGSTPPPE